MEDGDMRVPIYSYPLRYHRLFSGCFIVLTLGLWGVRVWQELAVETADSRWETTESILVALPVTGVGSVILGLIIVEVFAVLADLVGKKKLQEELAAERAENARLRARIKAMEESKTEKEQDSPETDGLD